jgi:nitrogen fixation/metabolism regulation signal transduction histidine kinase
MNRNRSQVKRMYERVKRLLETPEFLQVVMQNITSAVLVMDRDARIYQTPAYC